MSYALKQLNTAAVLGSFSKGVDGSRALNYGLSAGNHCAKGCRYHPENKKSDAEGRCYAIRNERRFDRTQLLNKLLRHEQSDPAMLTRKALAELQVIYAGGNTVPWFRISTNGSVPSPKQCTVAFKKALLDLLDFCDVRNIPVHFPVETREKCMHYRKLVGSRCIVRLSAENENQFLSTHLPVSYVGGNMDMTRIERVADSKQLARRRTENTGRRCIVCPAIVDFFINKRPHAESKAKCGNCVACALPSYDVIYPLH